ncbi:MAG TPA: Fic family protein [Bacillota bacterium]|nr:Fic family protein [Bacillota bacterium]HPJ85480.1 Fic family protein [Bacillota bacterium]HPQ61898.1 Fic family protein [Bacillota bacterium]HRX91805.1 Fic family protein [Candidatus Izemoplasmatales bacterium]
MMKILEVEALLPKLDDKKETLGEEKRKTLCDEFDKQYIYESTSFDNGDFSYEDVCFLLEDHSRSFPDKSEHMRKAIINNYHAIQMVHRLVKEDKQLDETVVKDLHQVLTEGLIPGGVYRTRDLFILGAKHVPPTYLKIFQKMNQYFAEINNPELVGLKKAAYVHLQILKIYPFMDANGRLARLLLNYQLMLEGFLPVSIAKGMRDEYYRTIDEYKINKDIVPFTEFLAGLEEKRIKEFLERE